MTTLRDEITKTVITYAFRRDFEFEQPTAEQTADRIIDLFRERFLSDEAAEAMLATRFSPDVLGDKRLTLTTPERSLAAVLDVITGDTQ
jgi:hypothetical protein